MPQLQTTEPHRKEENQNTFLTPGALFEQTW